MIQMTIIAVDHVLYWVGAGVIREQHWIDWHVLGKAASLKQ